MPQKKLNVFSAKRTIYNQLKTTNIKQSVMKNKDSLHDELNDQAPFLNTLKKGQDGYQVPANYFDNLEAAVFHQLDAIGAARKPKPATARPSFWQLMQQLWQPRIALAFAGILTLAFAAWWYFAPSTTEAPVDLAATQISVDDAEAYLMDNLMELEPEHIALVLPEESLPAITLDLPATRQEKTAPATELELSADDLEKLLRDMTDEELKDLML